MVHQLCKKQKPILAAGKDAFLGWRLTLVLFPQELSLLFCFVFALILRQERISHGPKAHRMLSWLTSKPQGESACLCLPRAWLQIAPNSVFRTIFYLFSGKAMCVEHMS